MPREASHNYIHVEGHTCMNVYCGLFDASNNCDSTLWKIIHYNTCKKCIALLYVMKLLIDGHVREVG